MTSGSGKDIEYSNIWQLLKIPRLMPTAVAHGFVEAPYFLFPTLLLLIQAQFSMNDWQIGLLGAGPMLIGGLMAPLAGMMGDYIQKTTVITLALGLTTLASALIGFFGDNLLIIAIGLGIFGISSSLYHPAGFGVVSQSETQHNVKNRMFAFHGVGGSLGAGLGPLSVGFLLKLLGNSWQKLYLIWVFPLAIYTIYYKYFVPPLNEDIIEDEDITTKNILHETNGSTRFPIQKQRPVVFTRGLIIIFAFVGLIALSRGGLSFFLPAFLSEVKHIPIAEAALIYSSAPLFGIAGQLVGGSAADKTSEKIIVEVAMLIQILVIFIIFVTSSQFLLVVAFCLLGAATSALWPATASLTASSSSKKNRGMAYGIYMAIQIILGSIAPILGGILKGVSYAWLFGFAVIIGLISIIIMYAYSEKTATTPLRTV